MAIHLDVYTRLHDREIRRDAQSLERTFDRVGQNMGNSMSAGVERAAPKVEKSLQRVEKATDKVADSMGNVAREQAKYDDLVARGDASRTQLITQSERLAKARRSESSAIREATRAHRDYDRDMVSVAGSVNAATSAISGMSSAAGAATSSVSGLGKAFGRGAGGGAAIGAIAGVAWAATAALADVGKAVVTASQSLWLLPAAAAAAGAGFAALKIGTLGFADAIESIRDPEKFATALQSLSPNAQQAALSIQSLLPQFDALKNSVQDSLFDKVGQTIEQLSSQYLPLLQSSLSSVAGSFNAAFQGAAKALGDNPELISNILNNVQSAFQNLATAAGPVTEALARIASVGSDFLPGLADSISNMAGEFATFIANAAETGQLKMWIEDGIAAVKELGNTIFDIGKVIYDTFGSSKPAEFKDTLDGVVTAADNLASFINGVAGAWDFMASAAQAACNLAIAAVNQLLLPLRSAVGLLNLLPGVDIPDPGLSPITAIPGTAVAAPGANGAGNLGGLGAVGALAQAAAGGLSGGRAGFTLGSAPAATRAVPLPTGAGGGGGSGPRLPDAPTVPYDPTVPGGSSPATFAAETSYLDARQKLAEKRARLTQLEGDAQATEQDRLKARNDVIEAERDMQGAEIRLNEARASQYGKASKAADGYASQMGEIGAQLDQDFGISKGLSGVAENITKFVANLAAAPLLGQLDAISKANPSQGGHGLMGYLGATGAFGPQYTGIQQQNYAASAMGPASLRPGAFGSDAALLANVPAGRYSQTGNADLTQGLADCSSAVEDLVNLMDGRPTGGRSMSTGNADSWLQSRGFMPGTGGPGDMRVAFNSGHMQATLPGGTPFNWGSDAAAARGGVGGTGADDPSLTSRYYRPAGPQMSIPTPSASDIYGPANTNPALTPPSLSGVPSMPGGPLGGGMPQSAPFANQQYGGIAPASGSGGGGVGIQGGAMDAAMMAAGGLDLLAPGAGQAAQTGMKLANRAIQYGGQVAGIGVQGAMETLIPFGGSELANNNWATRILGGLAGAAPALPNTAGKSSQPTADQVANADPNAAQQQGGAGQSAGNTYNVQIDAANREPQGIAKDFEYHTNQANTAPGMG